MQRQLIEFFGAIRSKLATFAFPEQRVQVKQTRFRVPDVCVYVGKEPEEEIFTTPPFLVIEILSREDRHGDVMEKIGDYLSSGVPYVWVIDPTSARAWIHTPEGAHEAEDGMPRTQNPPIAVRLSDSLA